MPGDHPFPKRRPPRHRTWLGAVALALCTATLTAGSGLAAVAPVAGTPRTAIQPGTGSAGPGASPSPVDVAPALHRALLSGGKRTFAIEFRERPDLAPAFAMDWIARGRYVHEQLLAAAQHSQAQVRAMLDRRGARYEAYWIKNAIVVRDGDLATLQASAAFNEVARIREVPKAALVKPEPSSPAKTVALNADGVAPNIAQVGADRVWANGTTGDGVTVGLIDDGVYATHEALWRQYRGNHGAAGVDHDYNWFSPSGHSDTPVSSAGHGNHVTGIIVGDNGAADPAQRRHIGMAPGARWIACQGLLEDEGTEFTLPACGQFMLAPTRIDGSAPDPDLRPQVVNNSWGSNTCDGTANDFYREIVENWIAAGIFPAFAAGNAASCGFPEPAGLSTVLSPASLGAAFAVGSTGNHDGLYAAHSLWGPSAESSLGLPNYPDPRGWPTLKPQVVAPGVDVISSIDGSNAYEPMTGTSMSTPHISGLVALMLEAGECLRGDYATLGTMIMQTARPVDYASGGSPPPGPGNVPNYATGWGEIDAPAAVEAAAHACGPQGIVRGAVTDAGGRPVPGARIEIFVDENVRIYQSTTENDGRYVRRLPVNAAGYTIRVSAYGYLPSSESGVVVQADGTLVHDVRLATAATYKINGRVTDATTGWPLHARIAVSGYPGAPVWTDPATGTYSIRLAEGSHYRFDVDTDIPGYATQTREVASITGGAQDFALSADLVACLAPGYAYAISRLSEDFEDNGNAPPNGWTRSSNGLGWLFGTRTELATSYFPVTEHGRFAAANDQLGAGEGWENDASADQLVTPPLDLTGVPNPVLTYHSYYFKEGYAQARVEASTDGGASWTALGVPAGASWDQPWTREAVSLAGVVSPATRIRFHSSDGTTPGNDLFGTGWGIDDVAVVGACAAPAGGGLVFGHVRDANTGAGLNGAQVRVGSGTAVVTASSADANLGDGYYTIHAPAGTPTVTAQRGSQPAGYGDASATPSVSAGANALADLALPAGRLRVYPPRIAASVELGTTRQVPVDVGNTGTLPLRFGFEQAPIEEHFDGATFPPAGWTVDNASGGCSWGPINFDRLQNYAGGDGDAAAIDLYPCWDGAASDTSLISPPLDLSSSQTASLGFFLALFDGADSVPRLDVDVSADGGSSWTTVDSQTRDNNGFGPGALIEIDLGAFVGSSDVRVRFHYTATPPWGWIIVDQVHLFNTVNSSPIFDLAPEAGTLAAGQSRTLNATFDARDVPQPGVYEVEMRMSEDTPYAWSLGDVSAQMTVTAPASWGWLAGTVRGLGYCEANPQPLAGAGVTIADRNGTTHTLTSAGDGSFKYWVDSALGPFTLTATAADHLDASGQFTVTAGTQSTADFGLRPLQACVVTDPPALTAQVDAGQSVQRAFELMNTGAAGADWTLRAGGDPSVKTLVPWVQTLSTEPEQDVSFGCRAVFSGQNSWMRKFDLSERNAPGDEVLVTQVNFAVNNASSLTGTQPLEIRVYRLDGEFVFANLHLVGAKTLDLPDSGLAPMSVSFDPPLSVSGDSVLVAEIRMPDGTGTGSTFYPGGNQAGETRPAYWASQTCGQDEPISYAEAHFDWIHLLLDIETMASDPCGVDTPAVDWLAVSSAGGSIGADSALPLQATFSAGSRADGSYRGSMCLTPGRGSPYPYAVPVTLQVGQGGDAIFADGFD